MVGRFQVTREQSIPGRYKVGTNLSRGDSHRLDGEDRVLPRRARGRKSSIATTRTACRGHQHHVADRPVRMALHEHRRVERLAVRQTKQAAEHRRVLHAAPGVLTARIRASPTRPWIRALALGQLVIEGPSLPRPRPGAHRPSPQSSIHRTTGAMQTLAAARADPPPSRRRRGPPVFEHRLRSSHAPQPSSRPDPVRSSRGLPACSVRPRWSGRESVPQGPPSAPWPQGLPPGRGRPQFLSHCRIGPTVPFPRTLMPTRPGRRLARARAVRHSHGEQRVAAAVREQHRAEPSCAPRSTDARRPADRARNAATATRRPGARQRR